ncbi:helix-turn-helix transcriptional regulator [Polaribacter sp.]|jgi:DNA-binding HxlR family transcriptional regulator|nr:helix-turn-helix transcriptional regulator [Polaribacter sp.]MDB4182003.1 helix-turn-helix transcriptional regulator [Polaribacter sp.]MDB9888490.1 helix-turn-helix transcriptional regulator [Polaribacter sp.]
METTYQKAIPNQGTLKFGKILQIVDGISRKVLSEQLKSLESDELVVRKQFEEIPLRVEYALTERLKEL